MEFSGKLEAVHFGHLLQWVEGDRRTGALVLRRAHREKRVLFRDGQVVVCLSDSPGDYYGRYLLLHGHLDEQALSEALLRCRELDVPLGVAVLNLGLLPKETVTETLVGQLEDQVCDLFFWRDGIFFFEPREVGELPAAPPPVSAVRLAVEGARRVDEVGRMRELLPHDEVRVERRGAATDGDLEPLPRRILRTVRGPVGLSVLHSEIQGSYFRFLEATAALVAAGRLAVDASAGAPSTRPAPPRISEMLLEQAVLERHQLEGRGVTLPTRVLEGLYPAWVGQAWEPEAGQSPARRRFAERLDGSRSLGELLSDDPRQRAGQLELLVELLGEGRLALLPAAAELPLAPPRRRRWFRSRKRG